MDVTKNQLDLSSLKTHNKRCGISSNFFCTSIMIKTQKSWKIKPCALQSSLNNRSK